MRFLISAGSNLSKSNLTPKDQVKYAHKLLGNAFGQLKISRMYENPAFPADSGPDFINVAFEVDAQIAATEMLEFLHSVEVAMGRERKVRWGPRTIDLDLLAADNLVLPDSDGYALWRDLSQDDQLRKVPDTLILPHPRLQDRAFVLLPLCDIAPDWRHPVSGLSVRQMCEKLDPAAVSACKAISEDA